ncbi:DUF6236 family protein [Nonomuraea sp. SBT364]|uniref:DUF6236 family protein n=1 Tax=Nonomuraea sp. SBT364 TaxID=1580530 RepID=UPI000B0B92E3|nr:DUF6236 family protein [Nonomuraea sp. SBT364]
MTEASSGPGYRRHGLYYPYFHIDNERWLKVAALYWPKLIRVIPDGYPMRDSDAVQALSDDFILRQSPGPSVEAVAPLFLDLVERYATQLRHYTKHEIWPQSDMHVGASPFQRPPYRCGPPGTVEILPARDLRELRPTVAPRMAAVHVAEMAPAVQEALQSAGLATVHTSHTPVEATWVVMNPMLVGVYKSVLAEDFAGANTLQPTTDQNIAYAVANHWTADRIAAVLCGEPAERSRPGSDELAETLAFLALDLVVPADLHKVPIQKIIDLREHYGAEFLAFGQAVDQTAEEITSLSSIRDRGVIDDYLRDVVNWRFAEPLKDLRQMIKALTGDAITMAINVKTEIPAAAVLAGGAWMAGHPVLAGAGAAAIGLLSMRRSIRQQRDTLLRSAPVPSFLLHTEARLRPRELLGQVVHQVARLAGTSVG